MEGGPSIQAIRDSSSTITSSDEELTGCWASACCNPRKTTHRFIALILMCLLGFGSYFCYDNPGALQNYFATDLNLQPTEYVWLYSIYSWPNTVMCFIGGFLIDRVFGVRLGTNIYMTITLIGQVVFSFAVFYDIFWLMLVGRFIFGVGAESLAVAQNNYAVQWFKGKELNMVFGLQLSFARVGSTVNFNVIEPLYKLVNKTYKGPKCVGIVIFIATLTCVLSLICSLILSWLDKRAERILHRNNGNSNEVRLMDFRSFGPNFWMVSVVCVAYYGAIFPFIALAKLFYIEKFGFSPQEAGSINSLVYLLSAILSPVLGFVVDRTGRNIMWVIISILCTFGAHSLLAFTHFNPYVAVVIMGISYSLLASSLWPIVSLIVPESQLGTAYGLCQAVQNLGLAVIPIIAGSIVEKSGYAWLEVFFLGCLYVALIAASIMWIVDMVQMGILNMTPSKREAYQRLNPTAHFMEREGLLSSHPVPVSPDDLLRSSTDFHIRNRYLSRIGAPLPSHYDIATKALTYRSLR